MRSLRELTSRPGRRVRVLLPTVQYSINKSKALLGFVGQQWEQHIVAELDSALNKWIDSVPDHRAFPSPVPPST